MEINTIDNAFMAAKGFKFRTVPSCPVMVVANLIVFTSQTFCIFIKACEAMQGQLVELRALLRHPITFGNGTEFAEHDQLAQATGLDVYFARTYCAWQRGTIEYTNGLVRQYCPKGTGFRDAPRGG